MRAPLPDRVEGDAATRPSARAAHRGRPLKRWRYVGVFGADVLLCAASVRIAGAPQWFWAVWDRRDRVLLDATRFVPGGVRLRDGEVRIRARRAVRSDLVLEPAGTPVAVTSPHGRCWIWTRKTPVRVRGTVLLPGRAIDVDALGMVDDSLGFHARRTAWCWSAGAGVSAAGSTVMWNLVTGVHDAPHASERTVWVDGVPREPAPVAFAPDLSAVTAPAGGVALRFAHEAERARSDDFGVFASDYRQPFGTFSGTLGDGLELAQGYGVMERHDVRW